MNRNLNNQRRSLFREQLMEAIGSLSPIQQDDDSEEHKGLSKEEKEIYVKFMKKFLYCSICHSKNHVDYLKKFFFTKDANRLKLKKQTLNLLKISSDLKDNISIGIPCCACFKGVFPISEDSRSLRQQIMAELRLLFSNRRYYQLDQPDEVEIENGE